MKRLFTLLSAVLLAITTTSQTITVTNDDGSTKQISAATAGTMMYNQTDGTLTIGGEAYQVVNIDVDMENANIATKPVAGTTEAAKRLYRYFRNNYGKKIISSVMANVAWNHSLAEKIKKNITGKWPAMNCYDFIHICVPDGNGWIDYSDITPVTEWVDKGGIVQLMWHFNVPLNESTTIEANGSGATFSPDKTTFKASNALVDGTWENRYFYAQMDRVIAVILKLQEAGIAATWRPFHEAAGNATAKQQANWTKAWFWWGYDGAETYRKLWIAMFDYFKQKGVNNLIWIWTTQ
ncbi:MAG: B-1,4-endoglucanase, partial [Prevotella sp.]|nr:B-1,4-endoglucanase [Prevotella sp.]